MSAARAVVALAFALVVVAAPFDVVRAQPASAAEDFAAGQRSFTAGRYDEALASFERSMAASPHPAIEYNIVVCLERMGRDAEAFEHLEHALADSRLEGAARTQATERLSAIRRRVAVIELHTTSASLRARIDPSAAWCTAPCRWVVAPGARTIALEDEGGAFQRDVSPSAGETLALEIEARERVVVTTPELPPPAEPTPPPVATHTRPLLEAGPLTIAGTVLTVMGIAGGLTSYFLVSDLHDRFVRDGSVCTGDVCSNGLVLDVMINVGWGIAAVAGILTVLDLFVIDHGGPAPSETLARWLGPIAF